MSREQAATRPPAAHWRGHPLVQAAVLVALVAGLLAAFLLFSHRSTATAIETASRNEARVLATQMEGALRRVEMSIAYVSEHGRDAIVHDAADTHGREQALTRLSGELRLLARQFPDVIAIFLAADSAVSFEVVVKTLDHSREDSKGKLFPAVAFSRIN